MALAPLPAHNETGTRIIADDWLKSQTPMIQTKCRRHAHMAIPYHANAVHAKTRPTRDLRARRLAS